MWMDFDMKVQQETDFSLEEALLLVLDLYFGQKW